MWMITDLMMIMGMISRNMLDLLHIVIIRSNNSKRNKNRKLNKEENQI